MIHIVSLHKRDSFLYVQPKGGNVVYHVERNKFKKPKRKQRNDFPKELSIRLLYFSFLLTVVKCLLVPNSAWFFTTQTNIISIVYQNLIYSNQTILNPLNIKYNNKNRSSSKIHTFSEFQLLYLVIFYIPDYFRSNKYIILLY